MCYPEKCVGCGRCRNVTERDGDFVCYNDAKAVAGKPMTADAVMASVLRDKPFYEQSGGGMTLSGGEPLFQFDFALELLQKAKAAGLHTALETCGFTTAENLSAVAPFTDLFLFDWKETDTARHQAYTGVGNERILSNLVLLNDLHASVVLRCPIVPGVNDRPDHFDGIAALADRYDCIERVEIEPYHRFGEAKYAALNRPVPSFAQPTDDEKQAWLAALSARCAKPVRFS